MATVLVSAFFETKLFSEQAYHMYMRRMFLAVFVAAMLSAAASAQMRGGVAGSARTIGGGVAFPPTNFFPPISFGNGFPSVISTGPLPRGFGFGFGFGFGRHFFNNNPFGGGFLYPVGYYPFGYYDNFYGDGYPTEAERPSPVVVVRDERPPQAVVSRPAPVAEPKLIDVPQVSQFSTNAPARSPAVVFILQDGRRIESQNFTITDSTIFIREGRRPATSIPVDQLNVDATLTANHQRGIDLQLPENHSEILLSF